MSKFNQGAAAVKPVPTQDPLIKSHAVGVASERAQSIADAGKSVAGADVAPTAARDAMFEKLSKMFRHTGTDVAAQALFRVIVEHRVETMGKHK